MFACRRYIAADISAADTSMTRVSSFENGRNEKIMSSVWICSQKCNFILDRYSVKGIRDNIAYQHGGLTDEDVL